MPERRKPKLSEDYIRRKEQEIIEFTDVLVRNVLQQIVDKFGIEFDSARELIQDSADQVARG